MFAHGGVQYPLTTATANSLLKDADPALFYTLAFLKAVLDHYIGPRLATQAALSGLTIASAVKQSLHVEPAPYLLADQFDLPALAVYRKTEAYADKARGVDQDVSEWEFAYLLPPLSPRDVQQLQPILRSAAQVIRYAIRQGRDASYLSNAHVWDVAGVTQARVTGVKYGGYEPIQEIPNFYRAIVGTIVVAEVDTMHPDALEAYDGEDAHLDHIDGANPTYVDLAVFATGPRIVSVSPSSGTIAGGTAVSITGANFSDGAAVLFGASAATGITIVNDITIQCVTPAKLTAGAVAVTVTDTEGRSDTLTNGFTYTAP